MGYAFTPEDVAYLRSEAGAEALSAASGLTGSDRVADVTAARRIAGDHGAAVLETVLLRRRAAAKLASAGEWLFTDAAMQQASATAVARHRAARLAGRVVHDVTCSVGADLVELARVARCAGSDTDEVRLAMARHNCAASGVTAALAVADALRPASRDAVVVADPARRDGSGRRTFRVRDTVPPLDELVAACRGRELAVKCAPGLDFDAVPWVEEIEVVSLDRQAREACLWRGFGTRGRRASVLRTGAEPVTVHEQDPDDCGVAEPGEWFVDPDPAVVRAGLVRQYACRHGLWQLDPRIAYLTGDRAPPGERALRVLRYGTYTEKAARAMLRTHGIGRLEILARGYPVDPDALRKRLRPVGDAAGTLVLTRVGSTPTALLCVQEPRPAGWGRS